MGVKRAVERSGPAKAGGAKMVARVGFAAPGGRRIEARARAALRKKGGGS